MIIDATEFGRKIKDAIKSVTRRNIRRASVASVAGKWVTLTDTPEGPAPQVVRLAGAPITAGDDVYLINTSGDPDRPQWICLGAEGEAVEGGGSGLVSPVPGASSSTDGGYLMGQAIPSGLMTEVVGQILSLASNVPQIGVRDTARSGGIFRFDTRSGVDEFVVYGYATGGSSAVALFRINLNTGDVRLAPTGGNVGIGISGFASARLQLPAGAGTAGKAPLKFTNGIALSAPEAGAMEYNGEFWTTNASGVRSALEKVGHTQPASSISDLSVAVSTIPSMNVRNANVSLPSAPFSILDAGNGVRAIEASSYQARLELDWDALNAYLANLNPLNARGVRASDSGLTGSTAYVDLGDPLLSIPVNSASAHSITVRGTLVVEVTTSTTFRHFLGKIVVSGIGASDGPVSTSPSVVTADHGPKVVVYLPLVWSGAFTAGTTTIDAKIQFRSGQSGTFLKILSGTSLIMDVKPLA